MTAADYQAEASDLARQAAEYASLTTQHTLTGLAFNYSQPLPIMPQYRGREWETTKEPQ